MSPQEQSSVENQGFSSSAEILSDEEIRSRAAAFAQRIFEQQMEAYEAQRAQAIAMMRAQEEYARQKAAYEEACREYYERQGQVAVRIDAETGEEIYTGLQNQFVETAESESDATVPADALPSEEPAPGYVDVTESASENSFGEEMLPTEDSPMSADYDQSYDTVSDDAYSSEAELYPQGGEEEISPEIPEEAPAPAAVPEPVPAEDSFPWFAVAVSIFCVSVLSAVGYILFSGDPRFEHQRKHFLAALHISENSVSEAPAKTQRKIEIPDFGASKPKPAPAPKSAPETAGVPAPLEAENGEAAPEEPSNEIPAEEAAVEDEEIPAKTEEPLAEEDEELFEDEEDWLDD